MSATAPAARPPKHRRHRGVAEHGGHIAADGRKSGDAEIELAGCHWEEGRIGQHHINREQD
jgi:hypothetical protein